MRSTYAVLAALAMLSVSSLTPAFAESRQAQVNSRIENQQGRVARKGSKKKMSTAQQMRADEATYRMTDEEQRMKTRHKGRLTRRDQRILNNQLDRNNARIK